MHWVARSHTQPLHSLPSHQCTIALALSQSTSADVASEAVNFLATNLPALPPDARLPSAPAFHTAVDLVKSHEAFAEQRADALKALQAAYPSAPSADPFLAGALASTATAAAMSSVLASADYDRNAASGAGGAAAQVLKSLELHQLVLDVGYACTASPAAFRRVIASVGKGGRSTNGSTRTHQLSGTVCQNECYR